LTGARQLRRALATERMMLIIIWSYFSFADVRVGGGIERSSTLATWGASPAVAVVYRTIGQLPRASWPKNNIARCRAGHFWEPGCAARHRFRLILPAA